MDRDKAKVFMIRIGKINNQKRFELSFMGKIWQIQKNFL